MDLVGGGGDPVQHVASVGVRDPLSAEHESLADAAYRFDTNLRQRLAVLVPYDSVDLAAEFQSGVDAPGGLSRRHRDDRWPAVRDVELDASVVLAQPVGLAGAIEE